MMFLSREERGVNCFNEWCELEDQDIYQTIKKLTIKGIIKYGF
jgi:hypothetical protein